MPKVTDIFENMDNSNSNSNSNSKTNKIKKLKSEELIKQEPISKIEFDVRKEMPWTMQNI